MCLFCVYVCVRVLVCLRMRVHVCVCRCVYACVRACCVCVCACVYIGASWDRAFFCISLRTGDRNNDRSTMRTQFSSTHRTKRSFFQCFRAHADTYLPVSDFNSRQRHHLSLPHSLFLSLSPVLELSTPIHTRTHTHEQVKVCAWLMRACQGHRDPIPTFLVNCAALFVLGRAPCVCAVCDRMFVPECARTYE